MTPLGMCPAGGRRRGGRRGDHGGRDGRHRYRAPHPHGAECDGVVVCLAATAVAAHETLPRQAAAGLACAPVGATPGSTGAGRPVIGAALGAVSVALAYGARAYPCAPGGVTGAGAGACARARADALAGPQPWATCQAYWEARTYETRNGLTLFLDSGVLSSNVVREVHYLFKTIEKEGLQGGKGDNNAVG